MNKRVFTLVELLAVIVLIAILAGLAIPNVMTSVNNTRKNSFLLDAKRMITKAEYLVSVNKSDRTTIKSSGHTYSIDDLNVDKEFDNDADGGPFDSSSFVYVTYFNNQYQYCACVIGSARQITGTSKDCSSKPNNIMTESGLSPYCVMSSDLQIGKVSDK